MRKLRTLIALLILSGLFGFGCYYKFVYKEESISGLSLSVPETGNEIYVDLVSNITGTGNINGMIQRYAGVVETQEEWKVNLEGEKKLKETYVKVDDMVKEGDKLFTYDTSSDEQSIEKDQIALQKLANENDASSKKIAQYEKELAIAKTEEDRLYLQTQILAEENQIKQNEYDAKTTQQEIDNLQKSIKNATVKSEIAGIIKSVGSENGGESSYMSNGENEAYIVVMAIGDLRIKGYANEQNIGLIEEGMNMVAYSRVDASKKWFGQISTIKRDGEKSSSGDSAYYGSSSDNATSSSRYPFYVMVDDTEGLMLGQHVYLEEDKGQEEEKEGLWLYSYYLVDDSYVWAENEKGKIEKRQVTVGEYDEEQDKYQILDGLSEDDYIAVPDQNVEEGLPVIKTEYSSDDGYSGEDYSASFSEDAGTAEDGYEFGDTGYQDEMADDFGEQAFDEGDMDMSPPFEEDPEGYANE